MKEWQHVIVNWNSRMVNLSLLGLLILGNFINHWAYFICLIGTTLIISITRYFHDKKWLKNADKYIRIKEGKPIWKYVLSVGWFVGWFVIVSQFEDVLDQYVHQKTFTAVIFIALPLTLENKFQKFVASVKSFEDGIQLPGRNQEIIPWKEIYEFSYEEKLFISSSKGEHTFTIDPEDPEHANAMIADWKERSGTRILRNAH